MRTSASLFALASSVLLLACGDQRDPSSAAPDSASSLPDCERFDYPCRASDVEAGVVRETLRQHGIIEARLDAGDDPDTIISDLLDDPSVAQTWRGHQSIGLRLKGGRPIWVYREEDFENPPSGFETSRGGLATPASFVVGRPNSMPSRKRALVLEPLAIPPVNERSPASGILSTTRGYESRVEVATGTTVDVDSFGDWSAYDVISVTTHGYADEGETCLKQNEGQDCGSDAWTELCTGALFAAELQVPASAKEHTGRFQTDDGWCLSVTQDYFEAQYPSGLASSIVFLNACSAAKFPSLVNHLSAGGASKIVGWDNVVTGAEAFERERRLLEMMRDSGLNFDDAFSELDLRDPGFTTAASNGARLQETQIGRRLHLREIAWLRDLRSDAELESGAHIRTVLVGTFGDGSSDQLQIRAAADGLVDEAEREDIEVVLRANDVELHRFDPSRDGEVVPVEDGFRWRSTEPVELGSDAEVLRANGIDPNSVRLELDVTLPGGEGHSYHRIWLELPKEDEEEEEEEEDDDCTRETACDEGCFLSTVNAFQCGESGEPISHCQCIGVPGCNPVACCPEGFNCL